jgi:hypothetical protein
MNSPAVVETLALLMLFAAMLVAARMLWCLVVALRKREYLILVISVTGLVSIVAASSVVAIVWFGYAVAHIEKTANTDLTVLFTTVPPFFLVSFGFWILGGKLQSRLRSGVKTAP